MIIVYITSEFIHMVVICSLQSFSGLNYFLCISLFNTADKSLNITRNKGVIYLSWRKVNRPEESYFKRIMPNKLSEIHIVMG